MGTGVSEKGIVRELAVSIGGKPVQKTLGQGTGVVHRAGNAAQGQHLQVKKFLQIKINPKNTE